jgi:hypothetical protein
MHYSLLVLLPKPPDDGHHLHDILSELLAPYWEERETDAYIRGESDTPNPDGKWDWWELGGRWLGLFEVRSRLQPAYLGRPGTFGNTPEHDLDSADATTRDNIAHTHLDRIHGVLAEGVWRDGDPVVDWSTYEPGDPIDWQGASERFSSWLERFWQSIPPDQWLAVVDYHR